MNKPLSWGLVIATYRREKILSQCLQLAVEQTQRPSEIIVIDASDDWQSTRSQVIGEIASKYPEIRWTYQAASQRGLTLQRNQGLELATADITFLFDDDSLMYPTCAEEIMRVYETDTEGLVKGVQSALASTLPSDITVDDVRKAVGSYRDQWIPGIAPFQRFIWRHLFLMDSDFLCIPYDGHFPSYTIPSSMNHLNVCPVKIFHGCRMTFRREAIAQEQFEPLLLFYALLEDMDASYRVSRQGMLLEASDAKLHHFQSNSGRLSRYVVSVLSAMNQAVCLRRYSNDLKRDRDRFYQLTARRVVAEVFKDALSRRWSFPQVRGLLLALKYASHVFDLSDEELTHWYPHFQQELIVSGKPPTLAQTAVAQPITENL
ncbi:glycosyltransferase family 2 protein [Phormidium sp. CLA17]|uniref:glycosyltransferase family 2 protein n=1 Tax=Leptolyngbya sp. Cla-17 TaxID=2803751 RepID=UPI001492F87E|nr:glycosyltransferase family 2 protein [Leptolyngbya sp. Cla-17]MBM0740904.1 glycosyltransferase family 2 protein [Leptolyngbya sp. Cla-17]